MNTTPLLAADGAWGLAETYHYIDCIQNDKEPMSRPEEAVFVMKIITGLYESADKGEEVKLSTAKVKAAKVDVKSPAFGK